MNLSLCCISNILAEQGYKFRTMTYKSFSSKERSESLEKLSGIIINNYSVTKEIIKFQWVSKESFLSFLYFVFSADSNNTNNVLLSSGLITQYELQVL